MVGPNSMIQVTSSPSGAVVMSATGLEGTTPFEVLLPNGREVKLTATHAAHPGDQRTLSSVPDTSRWVAGNILLPSAMVLVTDVRNPATRVHKQDIHFDFTKTVEELAEIAAAKAAAELAAIRRSGGTM